MGDGVDMGVFVGKSDDGEKPDASSVLIKRICDSFMELIELRKKPVVTTVPNITIKFDARAIVDAIREGNDGLKIRQNPS